MIADLVNSKYKLRLITMNVMSVFSKSNHALIDFIQTLKHSQYIINDKVVDADLIISYPLKFYNIYRNVYDFITTHTEYNIATISKYLSNFKLSHILWLNFNQLSQDELQVLMLIMQLSTSKKIIITDFIDQNKFKHQLYSLLYACGLQNKIIIIPFTNINDAINNSTCQCYVQSISNVKVLPKFSDKYLQHELNTSDVKYTLQKPLIYNDNHSFIKPINYHYSFYNLLLIFIYRLKMLLTLFINWRFRCL